MCGLGRHFPFFFKKVSIKKNFTKLTNAKRYTRTIAKTYIHIHALNINKTGDVWQNISKFGEIKIA